MVLVASCGICPGGGTIALAVAVVASTLAFCGSVVPLTISSAISLAVSTAGSIAVSLTASFAVSIGISFTIFTADSIASALRAFRTASALAPSSDTSIIVAVIAIMAAMGEVLAVDEIGVLSCNIESADVGVGVGVTVPSEYFSDKSFGVVVTSAVNAEGGFSAALIPTSELVPVASFPDTDADAMAVVASAFVVPDAADVVVGGSAFLLTTNAEFLSIVLVLASNVDSVAGGSTTLALVSASVSAFRVVTIVVVATAFARTFRSIVLSCSRPIVSR